MPEALRAPFPGSRRKIPLRTTLLSEKGYALIGDNPLLVFVEYAIMRPPPATLKPQNTSNYCSNDNRNNLGVTHKTMYRLSAYRSRFCDVFISPFSL